MVQNVTTNANSPETLAQEAEVKRQETAIQKVSQYLDSEIVKARFAEVVGVRNLGSYVASVMIVVKDDKQLQQCTPASIYTSALRAATLRLSVDKATGEAHLVNYAGVATLIVGYKGLYNMAVRTGKYRYINVGPIYEGQVVEENQITGFHSISGKRSGDKIIGWIGAFEMNPERGMANGFGKTLYMTVEEIHAHAKQYSKSYGRTNKKGEYTSPWQTETPKMERKTVLRLLLRRWGYLDPNDVHVLEEIEAEGETIDAAPEIYVPEYDEDAETHKRTTEENLQQLGFGA